ncbi:multi-sensor signal transduction histidine kinase [Thioalkalivibrio sp. K90mix]|nr:multi-sensor signal transduction histidine kinase [Thioalkalivibrio sp. K90mix]
MEREARDRGPSTGKALSAWRTASWVALVYLAAGLLWIGLSDQALLWLVDDVQMLGWLQTVKGFLYVSVTAVVLFLLLYWVLAARDRASAEARYLTEVVNRSPVVTIEWAARPGWPVVYVSPNVRRWGIEPEALLSGAADYSQRIHPEDREAIVEDVSRHMERGPDEYLQYYRLDVGGGHWIWVEDRTWLERDPTGEVRRFHGLLMDVTERVQAERNLRDSEKRFRAIFDNVQEGILLQDFETGAFVGANAAALAMYGYEREEILRCTVTDLSAREPGYEVERQQALIDRARRGEQIVFEWRARHRDGHAFWVEANLQATEIADERLLLVTLRNIEPRKKAEQALNRQMDRLTHAERHAGLGSWDYVIETGQLWWSDYLYELMGLDPQRYTPSLGDVWEVQFDPDAGDVEPLQDVLRHLSPGHEGTGQRFRLRRHPSRGSECWFSLTVDSVVERDDGLHAVQGTMLDITDLQQAEGELRQFNAELEARVRERTAALEAANQELESFSYAVSHDLKAPLRGIDGYSQLLESDYGNVLDAEGQMFIRNIRAGVAQMNELIGDLLDYSRMERRPLEQRGVRLQPLIEEVLDGLDPALRERAEIAVDVPPDLELQTDPDGLSLALRNLIDNALKFSAPREDPRIAVTAEPRGEMLHVAVSDNGIGFDMAFQERIFEIFQRLNRAEDYPGTGVGLALVRRALQRLGGRIECEGRPDAGATFRLELPL